MTPPKSLGITHHHLLGNEPLASGPRNIRALWPFVIGKTCPVCGTRTQRVRTPFYFRIFRILLGGWVSTRFCAHCTWRGLGFH